MDVLENIKQIIETYSDNERCGFCWNFFAPLTEQRQNIVRLSEPCCINVFLLRNKGQDFGTNITYLNGYINSERLTESYDLLFLIQSMEGLNNYNELPGHSIEESRHETIFKPLRDCIGSNLITDICNHYEVTQWSGRYIYDYQDEQYYGLRISITQSQSKE